MKTLLTFLFSLFCISAIAQTNAPAPPTDTGSFFNTVQDWLLSQNTNNTWSTRGQVSAGLDTIQNSKVNLANNIRISYEVYKGLSLEAGIRDSGVAGTLVSGQGGLSYAFKINDVRIAPYLIAGYDRINADKKFGEAGLRVEKKMTKWTFIGLSFGQQFPTDRRIYSAYTGFVF